MQDRVSFTGRSARPPETEAHKYQNCKPVGMSLAFALLAQVWPLSDLMDAAGYFGDVATTDPLSTLLIVVGNLLIVLSMAALGYLALGAAVDYVIPESPGRAPPRRE